MADPLILCWRGADGDTEPVPCECEVFGYPHITTTGDRMFDNTHFLTREEAWANIERSSRAQLAMASRSLTDARSTLRKAELEMVEAGQRAAEIHRKRNP